MSGHFYRRIARHVAAEVTTSDFSVDDIVVHIGVHASEQFLLSAPRGLSAMAERAEWGKGIPIEGIHYKFDGPPDGRDITASSAAIVKLNGKEIARVFPIDSFSPPPMGKP